MWRCALAIVISSLALPAFAAEKPSTGAAGTPDISGVWKGFVVEGKGEQPDRGPTHLELTIKDSRITAKRLDQGGESLGEGTYKITAGRVSTMNATEVRPRAKPRTYLGICALEPDVIKWCVATPGSKRPADFETKGQQFLLILKRQKAE